MQTEIEAKFLDINHDEIRAKLKKLGAKLEHPMRLMRRELFDHADNRYQKNKQNERFRIRDEGNKVTINYKNANSGTVYAHELETTVGSYDEIAKILKAVGFKSYSFQESKRETWHYKDVEVVLDEWPWLNPYIEIEGPNEEAIKSVAKELRFDWKEAKFGSVDTAYEHQYPGMTESDSIGAIKEVKFGQPLPQYFKDKMKDKRNE